MRRAPEKYEKMKPSETVIDEVQGQMKVNQSYDLKRSYERKVIEVQGHYK
jgi:hypothetical protein